MTTVNTETTTAQATAVPTQFDPDKAGAFVGKVVTDCAATVSVALAVIGDQLGLYRAMAGGEPLTSAEVAERTQHERALRPRVADQSGRRWVPGLPPRHPALCAAGRARGGAAGRATARSTSAAH